MHGFAIPHRTRGPALMNDGSSLLNGDPILSSFVAILFNDGSNLINVGPILFNFSAILITIGPIFRTSRYVNRPHAWYSR